MKLTIGPGKNNNFNSYVAELESHDFPKGVNNGTSDDKYLTSAFSAVEALRWDWVKDVAVVQGTWDKHAYNLYEDFVDRRLGIHNNLSHSVEKRLQDIVDYPLNGEHITPLQAAYYIAACYLETKRFTVGHKTILSPSTTTDKIIDMSIDLGRFIHPEDFAGHIAMNNFTQVENSVKFDFIYKFGGTNVNKYFTTLKNAHKITEQLSFIEYLNTHTVLSDAKEEFENLPDDVINSLFK